MSGCGKEQPTMMQLLCTRQPTAQECLDIFTKKDCGPYKQDRNLRMASHYLVTCMDALARMPQLEAGPLTCRRQINAVEYQGQL